MAAPLSFAGTRVHAGLRLQRTLVGPMAVPEYLLTFAFFGFLAYVTGRAEILVVSLPLVLFLLHVLRLFIYEQLLAEGKGLSTSDPVTALSPSLAKYLPRNGTFGAGDLLVAASKSPRGAFLLKEMRIDAQEMIRRSRAEVDETIDLVPFLQHALRLLPSLGDAAIDGNMVLRLLCEYVPSCRAMVEEADLSAEDLQGVAEWEAFRHRFRIRKSMLDPQMLRRAGAVGRGWVMGYTNALDWLTQEVPADLPLTGEEVVAIQRPAVDAVLHVLSRSTLRNVLVLGKAGVGKRSLVEHVAQQLRMRERAAHLPFTRVLMLRTQDLLSGVQNPDRFFLDALNRAQGSGHFILVIKDFPLLLKSATPTLKAVLLKFLNTRSISVIGIADIQDYHSLIKNDPAFDSLFEKLQVDDAGDAETLQVLMARACALETQRKVRVSFKALRLVLELCKRYLASRAGLPGGALLVLEDAAMLARNQGADAVSEEHVRAAVTMKSRVNVSSVDASERDKLLQLEERMQQRVIGQQWAVRSVASALKRARLDIRERKRPVGTFLFLGPTGVGKTQTAKVLAGEYFGSSEAMIRLDMNEYSNESSVYGIIGSPPGTAGASEGFLAQRVQDNPFSLILLDEIEKAHPKVLNVFLQILDEGVLTDARGVKTDFRSSIIIATSNAGALFIRDYVRSHADYKREEFKTAVLETILQNHIFSPEFVNRFDDVVLFEPLSQAGARTVAELMIGEVVEEIRRKRGITVQIEEEVLAQLLERGYSVEFGARELRRTITGIIEDYLADYLLRNNVKRGETIVIRKADVRW